MKGRIAVALTEPDGVGDPVEVVPVDVAVPVVVAVETPVELYDQTLRRLEPPQVSAELPAHGILHPEFPSGAGPPPF